MKDVDKYTVKNVLLSEIEMLERLVLQAQENISKQDCPDTPFMSKGDVLKRLETYTDIIEQQKSLYSELETIFDSNPNSEKHNKHSVMRIAKIIIELSYMVKEDAQSLLLQMETGQFPKYDKNDLH